MKRIPLSALLLIVSALPAAAHPGTSLGFSTWAGFEHPFSGLDHLTAMVAVGVWAALCGGKRIWVWPLTFVLAMIGGAVLGHAGLVFPFVEPAIAMSVLILGLFIALTVRAPLAAGAALVAAFAMVHGHAHGAEAPAVGFVSYVLGFAAATAILHGIGIAMVEGMTFTDEIVMRKFRLNGAPAAVGGVIAGLGFLLLVH